MQYATQALRSIAVIAVLLVAGCSDSSSDSASDSEHWLVDTTIAESRAAYHEAEDSLTLPPECHNEALFSVEEREELGFTTHLAAIAQEHPLEECNALGRRVFPAAAYLAIRDRECDAATDILSDNLEEFQAIEQLSQTLPPRAVYPDLWEAWGHADTAVLFWLGFCAGVHPDTALARVEAAGDAALRQMTQLWAICNSDWATDGYDCLTDPQSLPRDVRVWSDLRSFDDYIASRGGLDASWSGSSDDADSSSP